MECSNEKDRQMKKIEWGDLRRLTPFSYDYGYDRGGTPIDRYYIVKFLEENKNDIKGNVLEIQENYYTLRFGGNNVQHSDILDVNLSNKLTTIIADLRDASNLPKEKYDCVILTETLQLIDDYDAAIKNVHGMLKNNGVVLCTLAAVNRIDYVAEEEGDFWRFTKASARFIFKKHFSEEKLQIKVYGNVFAIISYLEGVSLEEITKEELEYCDKFFPFKICVRAVK